MKEFQEKDYGYDLSAYSHCSEYRLIDKAKKSTYLGWFVIILSFLLVSYGGWLLILPGIVLLLRKNKYAKIIAQRRYFAKKDEYFNCHPEEAKSERKILNEKYNEIIIIPENNVKKTPRRTLDNMPCLCSESLSSIKSVEKLFPLIILHIDTTGLNKGKDKIIKICADKYGEDFKLLETFSTFVNPGKPIPKEATKRNHITDTMVSGSPTFNQISTQFQNFIKDSNICSYFLHFHLSFLYKAGIDFSEKVKYYDVCEIVQSKVSESKIDDYQLRTVCKYYDVLYLGQNCDTIKNLFEEILTKYNKL